MKTFRILKNSLRSIMRNPMRTFLTTLGIVIGIASVIALMEIGNGAQETLKATIANMGVNTITVRPGVSMMGGVSAGSGAKANLTAEDAEAIRRGSDRLRYVSPVVSVRGQIIYGGKNWSPFSISGVNADYLEIGNWQIDDGSMFDALMVARGMRVCVVGKTIVRELFGGASPLGREIRIQNVNFTVIGVLKTKGANMMGMDQDDTVFAPWTAVRARLKGAGSTSISSVGVSSSASSSTSTSDIYPAATSLYPDADENLPPVRFQNVDTIAASAVSPEDVDGAVRDISAVLRKAHKIGSSDEDDFNIRTMAEFSDFLTSSTKTTTNLLLCVAFVSLVVGGVGIMNIMLVSVTERTREVGLRMAVGAKAGDILRQFLIEAVMICLLGGLIGIVAGHGASVALAAVMNWPSRISWPAILLSVGVSAFVGVVFGYYPAWKAAKMDPIEALRYE